MSARANVMQLAAERGESLASASRAIGKNVTYLHQFVTRKTPRELPSAVTLALAQRWRVDERLLGARDPWVPNND